MGIHIHGLNVETKGSVGNEPILLLHGFMGAARNLTKVAEALAESGYFVVYYDQRGHGHSAWAEEYNIESLAADVWKVCNHFQFKGIHLIGHSMGGRVCMAACKMKPESVRTLTVLDVAPTINEKAFLGIKEIIDGLSDHYASRNQAESSLAHYSVPMRLFLMSNLRFDPDSQVYTWIFHKKGLQQSLLTAIHSNQHDALSAFAGPVLFVRGGQSQHFTESEYNELLVKYPNVRGCVIDGAGHWIHADQHKLLVGALLAWLPKP